MNKLGNLIMEFYVEHSRQVLGILGIVISLVSLSCLISCGREEVLFEQETVALEEVTDEGANVAETTEEADVIKESYTPRVVMVHVCGAVRNPGVYELEDGSRIIDAVLEAGGLQEDAAADALNLAMPVSDGSRVYVPCADELTDGQFAQVDATGIAGSGDSGRVNINTASVDELTTLKGIGQSRAESIVAYREEHGPFKKTEDIMNISGIKQASYDKIKDNITIY